MSGSRLHLNFSNSLISPNHSFIRCLEVHFMCTSKYTPGPEELNRNQWRQWWECLSSFDCERSCFHLLHLEIFLMSFYEIYTLVPTHRLVLCWQLTCSWHVLAHLLWHFGPLCVYLLLLAFWCWSSISVFKWLPSYKCSRWCVWYWFLFLSQINPSAFSSTDILRMR